MNRRFRMLLISALWVCGCCTGGIVWAADSNSGGPPEVVARGEGVGEAEATDHAAGAGVPGREGDQGTGSELESESGADAGAESYEAEPAGVPEEEIRIRDPLMPVNRGFFWFNDKLYFWVLKPVAKGYRKVVPEFARISVRNFFSNIETPGRLINCLLQAKPKGAGIEFARFVVNTTAGVAGFRDPARNWLDLRKQREDFGQTLGVYGLGPVFYIDWPILGPSSVRGTVGYAGDFFLDPINWVLAAVPFDPGFKVFGYLTALAVNSGVKAYDRINDTSLSIGQYEELIQAALDPYIAVRNAYIQHRQYMIEN